MRASSLLRTQSAQLVRAYRLDSVAQLGAQEHAEHPILDQEIVDSRGKGALYRLIAGVCSDDDDFGLWRSSVDLVDHLDPQVGPTRAAQLLVE